MLLEVVWWDVTGKSNVCSLCQFHVMEKTATKLQLERQYVLDRLYPYSLEVLGCEGTNKRAVSQSLTS